jgi:hypothetical protein
VGGVAGGDSEGDAGVDCISVGAKQASHREAKMPYEFYFGSRDGQSTEGLIGDDEIEKTGGCWLGVQGKSDLSEVYLVDEENKRLDYDLTLGWDDRLADAIFQIQ